jgi:hypothetical protein
MPLVPRFLVNFWAGYRVTQFIRRRQSLGRGVHAQQAAFRQLMERSAGTEFGRLHNLTADTTYAEFCEKVPPRPHDYFAPLIARMAAGEPDVLIPGKCQLFVETAGTTNFSPKLLPVPEPMLAHFRHGLRDALYLYSARVGHAGVFLGRHLHVGASTALTEQSGHQRTGLDGILQLCLTPWAEANLYAPPAAIAQLPSGPAKIAAIRQAMLPQDVTLLGGNPAALSGLALAVSQSSPSVPPTIQPLTSFWPNLECCAFTGAALGLHAEPLRAALGATVNFHEIYAAAEGIIAAQDERSPAGLSLLTASGLFFEFIPAQRFNDNRLPAASATCLSLAQVEIDRDYELLVTTPAGLYRYATGDLVRFLSLDPPRLQWAGRTQGQLNTFGERVTEQEITASLLAVCERNGWPPINFHVAPLSHRIAAGQIINGHEWWLELGTHTIKTPTANVLAPELDAELARRNHTYAAERAARRLFLPTVWLVMPGVFAQWRQTHAQPGFAGKMPPCRPDRLIADQLATLTHFHRAPVLSFPSAPLSPQH